VKQENKIGFSLGWLFSRLFQMGFPKNHRVFGLCA